MILFRCDECGKETKEYVCIKVERLVIHSTPGSANGGVQSSKVFSFDVCSKECERNAVSKVLARIVPLAVATSTAHYEDEFQVPKTT